jgi:DnaJ-domain-containing protein 1
MALAAYGILWIVRRVMRDAPKSRPRLISEPIPFERSPFRILGVEDGASHKELRAAMDHIRQENDPARLCGLSEEIQETAHRRLSEAEVAFATLLPDEE